MAMDSRAFRDALGCFPTGVAVVTAAPAADAAQADKFAGAHIGITVNSFTSVSLEPPLLLWCMDRRSQRHDIFAKAAGFTVSILGTDHKEVSSRLARPGEHALDGLALLRPNWGRRRWPIRWRYSSAPRKKSGKRATTPFFSAASCGFRGRRFQLRSSISVADIARSIRMAEVIGNSRCVPLPDVLVKRIEAAWPSD